MSKPPVQNNEAVLRQLAFDLKKSSGMKLGQCYEAIAKQRGFNTYAAMRASMKGGAA